MMMILIADVFRQHHEKNGLLLWKRCVNDENRLEEEFRDLKENRKKNTNYVKINSKQLNQNLYINYN